MSQTRIRLTRAELYEKVWATPMRTLAQEFGMSDVGLAKVCRKHNIPVPPVGYWRRKETDYKVTQPVARGGGRTRAPGHLYQGETQSRVRGTRPSRSAQDRNCTDISHPLVSRSERLRDRGKLNQRGLVISKTGALAHILVSREQLPRALQSSERLASRTSRTQSASFLAKARKLTGREY
jgi:hypothetical protein